LGSGYGIRPMLLGAIGIYVTYNFVSKNTKAELERCIDEQEEFQEASYIEEMEVRQSLHNVQDENMFFKDVFNEMTQLLALIKPDGTILYTNQAMLDFTGHTQEELTGLPYWELSIWKHSEEQQNKILFVIQEAFEQESVRFATTHTDVLGAINEIDFVIKTIRNDKGEVTHFVAMGYNITELVKAQKALTERERQISAFFEYSIDGYFFYMLPEGARLRRVLSDEQVIEVIEYQKFKEFNPALCALMDIDDDAIESSRMDQIFKISEEDLIETWRNLITEGVVQLEVLHPDPLDGKLLTLELTLVAIWENDWEFMGNFGIVRDITNQREYERRLEFLANKDSLTGIDNRRTFFRKASNLMEKTLMTERLMYVMMFDLDYFKSVNDTYGHDVGDAVLKRICTTCQEKLPDNALFARYGGEEFTIIVEGAEVEQALEIAENVRGWIEDEKFKANEVVFNVTVSIGVTQVNQDELKIDEGLSRADEALYEAKRKGRNRVIFKA